MTTAETLCDELNAITTRLAKELRYASQLAAKRAEVSSALRRAVRAYLIAPPDRKRAAALKLDIAMAAAKESELCIVYGRVVR